MNPILITLVAVIFATVAGCEKQGIPKDTPSCILQEIKKIQDEEIRNPAGSVWQYEYEGKIVYYIPTYCCDIPSRLFDADCNLICMPDGGYTGKGDGKCSDFLLARKGERLIWKDARK